MPRIHKALLKREFWIDLFIYVSFGVFLLLIILNKNEFNIDEIYSYGLANHMDGIEMEFEQGVVYEPAGKPYYEYLCVQSGEQFQYANVWRNQKADVHPPLYYALLHTICSFFPGRFYLWNAAVINVLFAVLTLHYVRKLIIMLTGNKWAGECATVLFCCTPGIWYTAAFLRMYCMAMFLVTWFSYALLARTFVKNTRCSYVKLMLIAIMGALTHYYCIVFMVFISVVYGIWKLYEKQYKDLLYYGETMFLSGGIALVVFPSMLRHMFAGYRGEESIDNLVNGSLEVYAERLVQYVMLVEKEVCGGGLILLVGIVVCSIRLVKTVKNRCTPPNEKVIMLLLLFPAGAYFLLVSKMAVYIADRYMFPIYGVLFVIVFSMMYYVVEKLEKDKQQIIIAGALSVIWLIGGMTELNKDKLFITPPEIKEKSQQYGNVDCVFVYDERWKAMSGFVEVPMYRSVVFIRDNNLEQMISLSEKEELIVLVSGEETEETMERIVDYYDEGMEYIKLGAHGYTETYYLYRE